MKYRMGTWSVTAVALLLTACGAASEKRAGTEAADVSATETLSNSELQGDVLSDNAEEVTDQLAELSGSVSSFALSSSNSIDSKTTGDRTCTEGPGNIVTISLDRKFEGSSGGSRVSKKMSFNDSRTRIWSHPTETLKCSEKHLDFSLVAGKELGLKKEVKYSRTKSSSLTLPKKTRSKTVVKEGTRTVEYLANIGAADADGFKLHSLKINGSSSKTITTDVKGVESKISITSKTTDLLVDVNRNDSDFTSKLIKSGSVESKLANGVEFKLDYSQVKFINSEEDSCQPVSGSIAGSIKSADTTKSFTVTFSDSAEPEIKVDGAVSTDIEMDFSGCDFGKAK